MQVRQIEVWWLVHLEVSISNQQGSNISGYACWYQKLPRPTFSRKYSRLLTEKRNDRKVIETKLSQKRPQRLNDSKKPDICITMSDIDEGVKGKLFSWFHLRALKALAEVRMVYGTSRERTESAANDPKERQEKIKLTVKKMKRKRKMSRTKDNLHWLPFFRRKDWPSTISIWSLHEPNPLNWEHER